ncbi:PHP domain-containing protein [Desulfosediminicola flagellatus]|uniref:PHP domain-containing protein n=1 Tax=Desulfosediminicola flagellatus TaxID=2569541 RepID=UPI0010ABBF83|nr:PHP domain-containing protein [Desulfosediminicola flagellatus]
MSLDLHIHSTFSDGTLRPSEIVSLAKRKGLQAISITDHDTTEGIEEALEAGRQEGIEVITGIELSTTHNDRHIHLLGYLFNHLEQNFLTSIESIQKARDERNLRIIEKLQALGIDITLSEVQQRSKVGQVGRPHIAQVLIDKGVVRSINDAFSRFLKKGEVAYSPRKLLRTDDAISLIQNAGGIAVLAHPVLIDRSLSVLPELLDELVPAGLGGLEVFYPIHSSKNQKQLRKLADRYGLAVTGGSDYHGDIRPGTMLAGGKNVYVPLEVLQQLKDMLIA